MKKVMIVAVVAALLGICAPNVSAQVPGSSQPSSTQQDDDRDQQNQQGVQQGETGTSESQTGTSGAASSMNFNEEVKTADLPAAITKTINEKYPGYKTEKAYRSEDGHYKVKISKGDEMQTLFLDQRGESVKMKMDK